MTSYQYAGNNPIMRNEPLGNKSDANTVTLYIDGVDDLSVLENILYIVAQAVAAMEEKVAAVVA